MQTQSKDEFKEAMRRAKEQAAEETAVSEIKEPAKRGRKSKAEKEVTAKEIKKPAKREAEYNPTIEIKEESVAAAIDIKAISKAESNSEAVRAAIALMDTEIEKLKRQSQRYNGMALIYVGYRKTLEEIIQS